MLTEIYRDISYMLYDYIAIVCLSIMNEER
jgi:hypothetical protein